MRRIEVSLGFGALVCLLAWLNGWLCLWFLLAVLLHESGHFLALRLSGVPVTGFSLKLTGAVIQTGAADSREMLLCALMGPAVSLLAAAVCCRFAPWFSIVSGGLGLLNLLPLYPLDGGRILRASLELFGWEDKMKPVIRAATFGTCGLLMLLACWLTAARQAGLWPIFAVLILLCKVGDANLRER